MHRLRAFQSLQRLAVSGHRYCRCRLFWGDAALRFVRLADGSTPRGFRCRHSQFVGRKGNYYSPRTIPGNFFVAPVARSRQGRARVAGWCHPGVRSLPAGGFRCSPESVCRPGTGHTGLRGCAWGHGIWGSGWLEGRGLVRTLRFQLRAQPDGWRAVGESR